MFCYLNCLVMVLSLTLAGQTGVEPATFGFGDRCSTN